jgi:hypothetical protein
VRCIRLGLFGVFFLALTNSAPAHADLITGLVAYYPFAGNANDATGHGHDGTVVGATLTTGHDGTSGHAYDFNGSNGKITIPNALPLNMSGPMSITAWVKLRSVTREVMIVGKSDYMVHTNYLVRIKPGGAVRWEYNWYSDVGSAPLVVDRWYHIAVTAESPSTNTARHIYIDGVPQAITAVGSPGSHGIVAEPVTIGWAGYGYEYFDGAIDDVCIYNRELSAAEVERLAVKGIPFLETSPKSLTFDAQLYQGNPPPQSLTISTGSQDSLIYAVTKDGSWLSIQPGGGGPIPPNATETIGVNTNGLSAGVYNGAVILSSPMAVNGQDSVGVVLSLHDPAVSLLGTRAIIQFATWPGEFGDSLRYTVGPGHEYYAYDDGDVFKIETVVEIGDDEIAARQNIWYTGYGGGTVYGQYIRIGGLRLAGCGVIGGVQVLGMEGASLTEFGPDYVILHVYGGCAGWGCSDWGPYFNSIRVRILATECGACCDLATGNCSTGAQSDCSAGSIWHGEWLNCDSASCQVAGSPPSAGGAPDMGFDAAPNPFVRSTVFWYQVSEPGPVHLEVFSLSGRLVRTLVDGEVGLGRHAMEWDGRDAAGRPVATGIYFARVAAPGTKYTRAIVRIK